MEFEYDPKKSELNKIKHGISFEEAKEIWNDAVRVEFPAKSLIEERFAVLGIVMKKLYVAVVTYREESTRIISVRRARKNEEEIYYS